MSWRTYTDWAKKKPAALRLADRLGRGRGRLRWLDAINPPAPPPNKPDLTGWECHDLAAVWLGHATVLLRIGGMTILTDPVLSNRVGVGLGLFTGGPRRLVAPALTVRELPPIDLILISHAHFDHLDRPTLARLPKRTPVVTAHHTRDLIRDLGFRRCASCTGAKRPRRRPDCRSPRRKCATGARARSTTSTAASTPTCIESGRTSRVLYGGDTAYQEHFKRRRQGRSGDRRHRRLRPLHRRPRDAGAGVGDGRSRPAPTTCCRCTTARSASATSRCTSRWNACSPPRASPPTGSSSARWGGSGRPSRREARRAGANGRNGPTPTEPAGGSIEVIPCP